MLPTADSAGGARLFVTTPRWIIVRCGERTLALPVDAAHEIVPTSTLTRVPGTGPEVAGLLNLRGRVLTVFELAQLLGTSSEPGGQIVILEVGARRAGARVDAVLSVAAGPLDSGGAEAPGATAALGTTTWEGRDVPVVDPEVLLAHLFG